MNQLLEETITYTKERCYALEQSINNIPIEEYPTDGPKRLLAFIREALKSINEYLGHAEIFDLLKPVDAETRIRRYSCVIPSLYNLMEFIEGANIDDAPSALVQPFKRLISKYFSDTEIIIRATSEYNFTFYEIASEIKDLFKEAPFSNICDQLPKKLIVISFPRVEKENVLLQSIVAHELGHVFCRESEFDLDKKIVKDIFIKREDVDVLVKDFSKFIEGSENQSSEDELITTSPPTELEIRNLISKDINSKMKSWVKELCSDALGTCLFGPAFFFSFLDLTISVQDLDMETFSHPPPRIRIKFITTVLDSLDFKTCFVGKLPKSYALFCQWKDTGDKDCRGITPPSQVVLNAILKIIDKMVGYSKECLELKNPSWIYTGDRFMGDLVDLKDRLVNIVPPNETLIIKESKKTSRVAEIISILNIGWTVYKDYFDEFSNNLKSANPVLDEHYCRAKLNKILLKALEFSEAQMRWQEIQL